MLSLRHELLKVFLRNDFVSNPSSSWKGPFGTIVEPKGSGCLDFFNNFNWFYLCAKKGGIRGRAINGGVLYLLPPKQPLKVLEWKTDLGM